ncbi:mannan endo-1,6-alpha-mannosidase [Metschnikowia bicuspidata var. bicuspidata NRRL YB-4993]|uniref:Mannan endo-1,6-alpha-mannosidase n=1 Tax=Metschnikowia bicuspidata var. bicuspidata NRRL YB-4993 TaxID=869754 RepID=A0A1A0HJ10_9ASCO|nr:mannan endo-1,6-alpha-mannosidase [Metschnikowia bicuspidata var. bicuspidata NRRL YB-4993]OBA24144.1 mannan endo-1,6-alpha-mannosidase [Metschnikowia bicuspidata var. bicuspidata NRRL YB-4993]
MMLGLLKMVPASFLWLSSVLALSLDVNSDESVCAAAKEIVQGEMNYYEGITYGGTVGMFSAPYYWWHAGEVFGGWVDYWAYCASDNDTFTEILYDAMYAQKGDDYNYMPLNQSLTEGNDDQGVWGMAIMQAVERNFTNPTDHSWLYMIQAIFNSMNNRWDTTSCNGGLRWQIFTWNNGYTYKNSIANGCLFHIAARLYRYTGEDLYLEVAEKVYDWMWDVGYFVEEDGELIIYDGAETTENCTDLTMYEWSYTYGIFMSGYAYLYNATGETKWKTAAQDVIDASSYFFNGSIMTETTCAYSDVCNTDQRSFRSLFSRCLGLTATLIPDTYDTIFTGWLVPSAQGAAESCSGGTDGITCGMNWAYGGWDGKYGLGEQMSALDCVMSMITVDHDPLTLLTGGSSEDSDVSAGNDTLSLSLYNTNLISISSGDKAGAAILTVVVLGSFLGGLVWMLL